MVQFTKASLGEAPQDVNPFREAQFVEEFKPTTSQVLSAFTEEAYQGVGTLAADIRASQVEKGTGKDLTEEEYKNSNYYNPNLSYYNGMTEDAALLLSENQTDVDRRAFIINKASGTQTIAGFTTALAAGTFEPKNAAIGVATSLIGGAAINRVVGAKKLYNAYTKYGKYTTLAARGGVEGLVSAAIAEPSNRESADILRQDYTMADSMFNVAASGLFGAAFNVVPETFKDVQAKRIKLKNQPIANEVFNLAETNGLDPATMVAIAGAESSFNPNAINKDTGAFGLYQFTPETGKQYGVTAESSLEEQTRAITEFTKDNISVLQGNIGREPTPSEVYMAHWMGATGASKTLTSPPEKLAIEVFKENGLYKGYENKVLSQNGFDQNATVADLIVGSTKRMTKALGNSIDAPLPDVIKGKSQNLIIEELDTAVAHMVEGKEIDVANVETIRRGDLTKASIETQVKAAEVRFKYTETPEFKARFEGSKVVDDAGMPLRVYHGTKDNFTKFDLGNPNRLDSGWLGDGVYLTDSPDLAGIYANNKKGEVGANIMPLYTNIKNPLILSQPEGMRLKKRLKEGGKQSALDFTNDLKNQGYDGIVMTVASDAKEIVSFNPEQVIPAFGADDLPAITARLAKEQAEAVKVSVLKANDPTNSTALDETLVRSFDQTTKDLGSFKTQEQIADLEMEIEALREQGLLDEESLSALGDLEGYKMEDIQAGYEAAYLCLTRG